MAFPFDFSSRQGPIGGPLQAAMPSVPTLVMSSGPATEGNHNGTATAEAPLSFNELIARKRCAPLRIVSADQH